MTKTLGEARRYPRSGAMGNLRWETPTVRRIGNPRSMLRTLGLRLLVVVLSGAAGWVAALLLLIGEKR